MNSSLRVLHLEDDRNDAELVRAALEEGGIACHVTRVETRADFLAALENGGVDLVLADYTLPSFDGLSALAIIEEKYPEIPFIFVSGVMGEELAIETIKDGATDYVIKKRLSRIVPVVNRALEEVRTRTERKLAEEELKRHRDHLEELVEARTSEVEEMNQHLQEEIIERARAEEELKHVTDELKHSNADLQQFAYAASHDLQEPLRAVDGFAKLLEKRYKGKLDAKADEFIEYIVDGIKRMQLLIRDLLAYSQVGTKEKIFQATNCSEVLERALLNLHSAIEESGVKLTYDILPMVMADPSQLIRLFQNLIGNAIKFRGERPLKIHISAEQKRREWIFSVCDNGIGIDSKQFDRIFIVFQRLHTREKYDGTGIGLSICNKIVEHYGGRIWVESEPGRGSTFYFTIPAME
jgi:signal transduction histidine kinase